METQILHDLQTDCWQERTLDILRDSAISQEAKSQAIGRKKHKVRWMKRPMAIPLVILELQNEHLRETALRCLSTFLLEKREEDPENYDKTGYFLYNSCGTMAVLLQEVLLFSQLMADGMLTIRASKRFINVLTLFQCIAANKETRRGFVKSRVPNFLVPLMLFETSLEVFESVRVVALSVVGILCQFREHQIVQWALDSNMVEVCWSTIEIGNEISKVISMYILESIMQDDSGISYTCSLTQDHLLEGLMKTWNNLIHGLALDQDSSPQLLFHIIRCYILLCTHIRGFSIVKKNLPDQISDGSFNSILEEFPAIRSLRQQLFLIVGGTSGC